MGRKYAVVVIVGVTFLASAIFAANARPSLVIQQGDTLSYDVAIELQTHPNGAQGGSQNLTSDSTVSGSAVLTGLRVDDSGAARARLDLSLHFTGPSAPQLKSTRLQLDIDPDGSTQVLSGDPSLLAYVSVIPEAARAFGVTTLHVRDELRPSLNIEMGTYVEVQADAKVVGAARYRGYPVYVISTTGGGTLREGWGSSATTERYTFAGTIYYDRHDRILVGQTYRTNGDVESGQGSGYLVVATSSLLLHSVQIGASVPASPSPIPTASTLPSPEESPSPTPFLPGGYYTPPPPSPSPSGPTAF